MEGYEPGSVFGGYTIEGLIAGGGMGRVYAARHEVYGNVVALKVLHPQLHADDSWRQRFNEEGLVGTRQTHPEEAQRYTRGHASEARDFKAPQVEPHPDSAVRVPIGDLAALPQAGYRGRQLRLLLRRACLRRGELDPIPPPVGWAPRGRLLRLGHHPLHAADQALHLPLDLHQLNSC